MRGPSLTCNIGECVSKEEGAACRDTRGHNSSKAYALLRKFLQIFAQTLIASPINHRGPLIVPHKHDFQKGDLHTC